MAVRAELFAQRTARTADSNTVSLLEPSPRICGCWRSYPVQGRTKAVLEGIWQTGTSFSLLLRCTRTQSLGVR